MLFQDYSFVILCHRDFNRASQLELTTIMTERIVWHTSEGVRTLEGAEAHLVRELVHYLLDQILVGIDIDEAHRADVPIFDALQPTQQLVMLYQVARGLLDSTAEPIELTAINEGTIYAMFCELRSLIEIEIDFQRMGDASDNTLRTAAIEAWSQHHQWSLDDGEDETIPDRNSSNFDHWIWFVELIADQILWDRDFSLDELVADIPPEKADQLKAYLGIQQNYYSAIAPDVMEINIAEIRDMIHSLVPAATPPAIDL